MTQNNRNNVDPVIENVNQLLYTARIAKGIYHHHRKEKRMWSPSPGNTNPSYTTQQSPDMIGGLMVPKTKKVMTRRSSTSMNNELEGRLNNLPSPKNI